MKIYRGMSKLFMAFSHGKTAVEANNLTRYKGIGQVQIIAVNPTREEWNKIFNTDTKMDPISYTGSMVIADREVETVRITFIVKTVPIKCNGVDATIPISFFLRKQYVTNGDNTKIAVIDSFGRTAWVTKEQLQNREIPIYSNGPAKIANDYRPYFRGENDLTAFIRAYLAIDDIDYYNAIEQRWEQQKDTDACKGRLDNVANYFKGDISEIKDIIAYQPDNTVKVVFGIRHDDNNDYQTFFPEAFLKYNRKSTNNISKLIADAQDRGSYPDTDFSVEMIKGITSEPTDFTKVNSTTETIVTNDDDLPFAPLPKAVFTKDGSKSTGGNPWGFYNIINSMGGAKLSPYFFNFSRYVCTWKRSNSRRGYS